VQNKECNSYPFLFIMKSSIQSAQDLMNLFRLGFQLHIGLDVSYSNSYEHEVYIKVQTKETLYCSVARGRQTKRIDGRKKSLKFCLFIITSKCARALQRKKLILVYHKCIENKKNNLFVQV
jgi:hypothetical protein